MYSSKLQRWSYILNYHRTRESQAKEILNFIHTNGNENPADIVNNIRASNTWFHLMKPLLFWHDMDLLKERVVPEGSENMPPTTPPLSS